MDRVKREQLFRRQGFLDGVPDQPPGAALCHAGCLVRAGCAIGQNGNSPSQLHLMRRLGASLFAQGFLGMSTKFSASSLCIVPYRPRARGVKSRLTKPKLYKIEADTVPWG